MTLSRFLIALFGLWLFGMGYGLIASVLIALVRETEHILKIMMMPLYLDFRRHYAYLSCASAIPGLIIV